MPANPEVQISPLVGQLYDLDAQIEKLQLERKAIAEELIERGEGTYCDCADEDRTAAVVVPSKFSTSYDLYKKQALEVFLVSRKAKKATPELLEEFREEQEKKARELAGDQFKALFDRVVSITPAKGFEDLVPKLLTTKKGEATAPAKQLLLLCQVVKAPGSAYVKLLAKPKAAPADEV